VHQSYREKANRLRTVV